MLPQCDYIELDTIESEFNITGCNIGSVVPSWEFGSHWALNINWRGQETNNISEAFAFLVFLSSFPFLLSNHWMTLTLQGSKDSAYKTVWLIIQNKWFQAKKVGDLVNQITKVLHGRFVFTGSFPTFNWINKQFFLIPLLNFQNILSN